MSVEFLLSEARACITDTLIAMAANIASGFTRYDEDDFLRRIEEGKNEAALLKTTDNVDLTQVDHLLQELDKHLHAWNSIDGRGRDSQGQRRVVLGDLRDWYVGWCMKHSGETSDLTDPETTGRSDSVVPPDHAVDATDLRLRCRQVITACAISALPGVFLVGCFDKKKTVHTQQRRAAALVNSLAEFDEVKEGTKIAVVGGGFGGLMLAVTAANCGADVHIFERQSELVPLQRSNEQRYLHPNIYSWPSKDSSDPNSRLPFLNWSAGLASEVAATVLREFDAFCNDIRDKVGAIQIHLNTDIDHVEGHSDPETNHRVRVSSADSEVNDTFNLAFVAVGFGIESDKIGGGMRSYWENDSLAQPLGFSTTNKEKIVISGTGDGALIDTARACIKDFRHELLIEMLQSSLSPSDIDVIQSIERQGENYVRSYPNMPFDFFREYKKAFSGRDFHDFLSDRVFPEREVILNHRSPTLFSIDSSIANRLIVFMLVTSGFVQLKRKNFVPKAISRNEDEMYPIRWREGDREECYHQIIVRHGTNTEFLRLRLPELWTVAANNHQIIRELEVTSSVGDDLVFAGVNPG